MKLIQVRGTKMNWKTVFLISASMIFKGYGMEQPEPQSISQVRAPVAATTSIENKTGKTYYLRFRDQNSNNIIQLVESDIGVEKLSNGFVKFLADRTMKINVPSSVTEVHLRVWQSKNLIPAEGRTNSIVGFKWKSMTSMILKRQKLQWDANTVYEVLAAYMPSKEKPFAVQSTIQINENSALKEISLTCKPKDIEIIYFNGEPLLKILKTPVTQQMAKKGKLITLSPETLAKHDAMVNKILNKSTFGKHLLQYQKNKTNKPDKYFTS